MMTVSLARNWAAFNTMKPRPRSAATISAATSVGHPTPMPMRMPVKISGMAAFRITCQTICIRVPPIA
ncbi:hypothetical protein G6F61_015246 [Rhizopus arrhizus]|nr:hypothetical protein G6F61_015246 [Rhizopus arrhizus]